MDGETRKLQKVGGGTFTVSVPKEWATEQSLSAGDTVTLYPDGDGSLVVCRERDAADPVSATVDVDHRTDEPLDRVVRAAYAAGVERLTLEHAEGLDAETRRRIDHCVREHTGMRVGEEGEGTVTIRTVLDDGQVSVRRTVVQLQFVTLSLLRTAVDLALDANPTGRDRIEDRRVDAEALSALVTRQFGRSLSQPGATLDLGVDRVTAFDCYRVTRSLERVATLSTDIAAVREGGPVGEGAIDPLHSVAEAVRYYVEEATAVVVDDPPGETVQDVDGARAEVATLLARADDATADTGTGRELHRLLGECADCGDRIADVAREATVRRDDLRRVASGDAA